jgi:hypothetical protein
MARSLIAGRPWAKSHLGVCIIAVLLFLVGVAGKFHFSSIGMWNTYLDRHEEVPGLLAGTPKFIRSDEWQLGVPWLLSQYNSQPKWSSRNPSVGAETSALLVGLPTKHWSAIFRPAHWGFFLFDFDRGFSWLWMFRTVVLFFSLVLLCTQIGAGSLVLGLLGAVWVFYSSFVQWWLASVAELLAYFALACLSLRMVFQADKWWQVSAAAGSFLLFAVAFALVVYPPFQVPLLYLGVALLPLLLSGAKRHSWRSWGLRWFGVGLATTFGAGVVVAFLLENSEAVQLMSGTVYPGTRLSHGGAVTLVRYFSGFFDLFFRQDLFPARFGNMSETSSFIVLWPLALLRWRGFSNAREMRRCAPLVVYLMLVTLWGAIGVPGWLASISGWSLVPSARGGIAWGLGGVFLCIAMMARTSSLSRRAEIVSMCLCAGAIGVFTVFYRNEIQLQISPLRYVYAGVVGALLAFAVVLNRRLLAALALVAACVVPNCLINPLMRGVSVLTDSMLLRAAQRFDAQKQGTWVVVGEPRYAQVVKASGRRVINGSQYIPNLSMWRSVDPQGVYTGVYNRYAHIGVRFGEEGAPTTFQLVTLDAWQLTVDPCGSALSSMNVTHLVWVDYDAVASFSCLERVYVEKNIAVYKLKRQG